MCRGLSGDREGPENMLVCTHNLKLLYKPIQVTSALFWEVIIIPILFFGWIKACLIFSVIFEDVSKSCLSAVLF